MPARIPFGPTESSTEFDLAKEKEYGSKLIMDEEKSAIEPEENKLEFQRRAKLRDKAKSFSEVLRAKATGEDNITKNVSPDFFALIDKKLNEELNPTPVVEKAKTPTFEVGDIVKLKVGGPAFIILQYDLVMRIQDSPQVKVGRYLGEQGMIQEYTFDQRCLTKQV